jgi:hypothetical protein
MPTTIPFGKCTVQAVPPGAVFEIDIG